jgi:hypothetical protein
LRIERAKIALVPGAESQIVVLGEILEAGVHPIDTDARLLEVAPVAIIVEIGRNAGKFARNDLLATPGERFRLPVQRLRGGGAILLAGGRLSAERVSAGGARSRGNRRRRPREARRDAQATERNHEPQRGAWAGPSWHCGR